VRRRCSERKRKKEGDNRGANVRLWGGGGRHESGRKGRAQVTIEACVVER